MKTLLKCGILFIFLFTLSPNLSFSQQQIDYSDEAKYGSYGEDAVSREENHRKYIFLHEAFSMRNFEDAIKRLEELISIRPMANENMYIIGLRLYRSNFTKAETPEVKASTLNDVLRMYDLRADHFGNGNGKSCKHVINGNKARLIISLEYMWDENVEYITKQVNDIIKNSGKDVDLSTILVYFKALTDKFMQDRIDANLVLTEFEVLSEYVDGSINPKKGEVQETLDALLVQSEAAGCDKLELLFKPQYQADPTNIALIKKILRFLDASDCSGAFKTMLSEKYYKLDPSANAAYNLATSFASVKDYPKAIQYFNEAISRESNRVKLADYQFKLAGMYLQSGNYNQASVFAKKAILADPRKAYAYLILAQSYDLGSSEVTCGAFEKKTIYWLIVGTLEKGRTLLAKNSKMYNDVNKMIASYEKMFPSMEDIFFREGLKVGDRFSVNCGWIKGVTKIYDPVKK